MTVMAPDIPRGPVTLRPIAENVPNHAFPYRTGTGDSAMMMRERRYPARLALSISAALDADAERYGIAPGILGRWVFEAEYGKVRERLRKQARKAPAERGAGSA